MMKIKTPNFRGKPAVVLGLSHANLDRLRADGLNGHIHIKGEELQIPFDIVITAAETEGVMLQAFQEGIQAGTKVAIDKRLKS